MRFLLLFFALVVAIDCPAFAFQEGDTVEGRAAIEDGNTLFFYETASRPALAVKLFGITAPDINTVPGWYARDELDILISKYGNGTARCLVQDVDVEGTIAGICTAGDWDLGWALLSFGYAVTDRAELRGNKLESKYLGIEVVASSQRRGLWRNRPKEHYP